MHKTPAEIAAALAALNAPLTAPVDYAKRWGEGSKRRARLLAPIAAAPERYGNLDELREYLCAELTALDAGARLRVWWNALAAAAGCEHPYAIAVHFCNAAAAL